MPESCPCNRCRGTDPTTCAPFRPFAEPRHASWTPRPLALSPAALSALERTQTTCERGHQRITYQGTDACPLCTALESTLNAQARALVTLDKLAAMQERAHAAELAQLRTRGELEALQSATRPVAHALPDESVVLKGPTARESVLIERAIGYVNNREYYDRLVAAARDVMQERDQ